MKNHIPKIVVTGGPCAGKTTILSSLQQKLGDLGFTPVIIGETATELILSGIKPGPLDNLDFERQIFQYMIEKEDRFEKAAQQIKGEKKVIICDRGLVDISAYVSSRELDLILGEANQTMVDIRDKRYDAVIFLRSVAVDAPDIYTRANNAARRETLEEAKVSDERTLAGWVGHPHVAIIDNSTDIKGKSQRVLQAICRVLGIPAPLEIERKYFVSGIDLSDLPRPVQEIHIVQDYLKKSSLENRARVRSREQGGGFTYYHTVKEDVRPGVRVEIERQITRKEYLQFLASADPDFGRIEKTRHCFVWKNQYFELDSFRDPNGLVLLEIELTEENETVSLPTFLRDAVDVTDDPQYRNEAIARRIFRR